MKADEHKYAARCQMLHDFHARHARLPTYSELMALSGLRSKAGIGRIVVLLDVRGMVRRTERGRLEPGENWDQPIAVPPPPAPKPVRKKAFRPRRRPVPRPALTLEQSAALAAQFHAWQRGEIPTPDAFEVRAVEALVVTGGREARQRCAI